MEYLNEIGWFLTFPATIILSYYTIKHALKVTKLYYPEEEANI